MKNVLIFGGGLFLAIILVAVYLSQGGKKASPTPAPTTSVESTPGAEVVREITIEGDEFSFTPSVINAKVGEKLKITFVNKGSFSHNFSIPDYNIESETITKRATDQIELTVDKAGTFRIICTVTGHENLGMTGSLIVE